MTKQEFLQLAAKDFIVKKYGYQVANWPALAWWTMFETTLKKLKQASESVILDIMQVYGITRFDNE